MSSIEKIKRTKLVVGLWFALGAMVVALFSHFYMVFQCLISNTSSINLNNFALLYLGAIALEFGLLSYVVLCLARSSIQRRKTLMVVGTLLAFAFLLAYIYDFTNNIISFSTYIQEVQNLLYVDVILCGVAMALLTTSIIITALSYRNWRYKPYDPETQKMMEIQRLKANNIEVKVLPRDFEHPKHVYPIPTLSDEEKRLLAKFDMSEDQFLYVKNKIRSFTIMKDKNLIDELEYHRLVAKVKAILREDLEKKMKI